MQTHEHKNKLHTIAGLLQLGHTKLALQYVTTETESEASLTKFLNERFHNENISGLLLSKVSYGKELGIQVEIEIEELPKGFNRATLDKVLAYIEDSKKIVSGGRSELYWNYSRNCPSLFRFFRKPIKVKGRYSIRECRSPYSRLLYLIQKAL